MQLAPGELARRTPDRVIYSHGPRTVSITLGPTITRDGHQLSLQCALTTHLVERDADLVLFNEQLLQDRSVVTLDSVRQHLAGPLATSLAEFAQQHDAATCLAQRATVSQLILKRANDIGFACGLEFLPPLEVQLRCPTLEAQQAAEQVARQQSSEAQHAVQLLQILNSAGATALAEPQQAALIPFLLKQQPSKTILLVAGEKLIECQPASDRLTAIPVPPEIGLLRSVSTISLDGRLQTAVGGQRGVALLGDAPATLLARTASERGFNAVTVNTLLRQIVATHGEFGLMRWSLNHGPTPEPIAVAGTPRHLTSVDERIVFAVDQRLFVLDGDYVRLVYTADELILKLIVMSDALIIVCRSGVLERLNRSTFALISRFSRRSLLTAAAGADVEGLQLIFLVGEAGPVAAFAPDGTLRLELHSPYAGLRMLSIAGGYIVGVSADRQHLVTWQGWSPAAPLRATNIVAQSGHRISDLAVR